MNRYNHKIPIVNDFNDILMYLSCIEKILLWIKQLARETKTTDIVMHINWRQEKKLTSLKNLVLVGLKVTKKRGYPIS